MTVTASQYARVENDLYQTEPWVTKALIERFPIKGLTVWEPAAGNHLMADVLSETAKTVITSDIVIYNRPHNQIFDFLKPQGDWPTVDAIITNPPYGHQNIKAVRFAEYALNRCQGLVALLLTAKFDFGKTRQHLFRDNPRFAGKIALVDRISWTLDGATGTEDHAWYIWTAQPRRKRSPVLLYAFKDQ